MAARINRQNMKLNIGKISKKISDLELHRKKIVENVLQLKQARDKLIIKLRTIPDDVTIKPEIVSFSSDESDPLPSDENSFTSTIHESNESDANAEDRANTDDDESKTCDNNAQPMTPALSGTKPYDKIIDNGANIIPYHDTISSDTKLDDPIVISDDEEEQSESYTGSNNVAFNNRPPLRNISNVDSEVKQSLSEFNFKVPERQNTLAFKVPANPGHVPVRPNPFKPPQSMPKSKKFKHFEEQHIKGNHKSNKPVNSVGSFDKAKYRMLRPSGRRGATVRGRLIDEVKFVTKEPIPYSGTGWKNRGVEGHEMFVVTGNHDQERQAVQPVHLDGKAQLTREGKVVFQGQLYSQYSQTQGYCA